MLGYTGTYKGQRISVQGTGMGVPSISIYATELMQEYGVKNLIRVGTCGAIQEDVKVRDVILAMSASEGTVSPLPGQYEEGSTIQVQAQPASGWRFVRWQGDLTSTNAQTTITMNGNRKRQSFEKT